MSVVLHWEGDVCLTGAEHSPATSGVPSGQAPDHLARLRMLNRGGKSDRTSVDNPRRSDAIWYALLTSDTRCWSIAMVGSRRRPGFQIEKVWAKNFRSIADATLDLGPMTLLVGPNASGKSNVLDVLRFLKDALRFDLEAAVSMRRGFDAILRRTEGPRPETMEIGITATTDGTPRRPGPFRIEYSCALDAEPDGGYVVAWELATVNSDPVGQQEPLVLRVESGRISSLGQLAAHIVPEARFRPDDAGGTGLDDTELNMRRLVRAWTFGRASGAREVEEPVAMMARALEFMLNRIARTRYYHIFPNTIREPQTLGSPQSLDEDAGNLASVLRNLERGPPGAFGRLKRSLAHLVPGVSDIEVSSVGGYLVVRLKHENIHDGGWLDLAQQSDGTIRLLGLLTGLNQTRPLPLIGIEEPELTVHPGALTALSDVLKEATRRSQLVLTTHSPELIDRITDFRDVEPVRIVELVAGETQVNLVSDAQKESVARHLFSPGELHRMGELEQFGATT